MQFDWTTFGLEILNFAVLVWLLKRFFYRPVGAAIELRRHQIEVALTAAERTRTEAEILKSQCDQRLRGLAAEERLVRNKLDDEIRAERERRLAVLETELKTVRDRARTLAEREARDREASLAREALIRSAKFASQLLSAVASPELDKRLLDLLLEQLPPDAHDAVAAQQLRGAWSDGGTPPVLATAHPLDATARLTVKEALEARMGKPGVPVEFRTEPALLAGAQLRLGTVALGASLQDELRYFRDAFHAD